MSRFLAMKSEARSWDWPLQHKDGLVTLVNDSQRFAADLEIPSFKADEVDVVVLKDELVVRCDNANDAGRCKRQVQRAYRLPRDIDVKTLKSTVKSNGTLQITANKRRLY